MTFALGPIGHLSDQDVLMYVQSAGLNERHATARLIALLSELDARRLYLAQGCSWLFTYCTQVLHPSEHAAYGRIEAARAARRFPVILRKLADGSLNLTAIGLLAPHLTSANHLEVLEAARHRSKRELEQLVARLNPKPDAPLMIRKLPDAAAVLRETVIDDCAGDAPARVPPAVQTASKRPAEVKPLTPERYKVQFTVNRETYERLRRVQDLMRHTIPNGDPALIFDRALRLLLDELSKTKFAAAVRPRAGRPAKRVSRHIPATIKRAVWQRDGGQCGFRGTQGRCMETGFLEFHHVVPFAEGGATTIENIELRCRAHNAYEAEQWFGPLQPPLLREARNVYAVESATRAGPSSW